jgi:hypothetical protein
MTKHYKLMGFFSTIFNLILTICYYGYMSREEDFVLMIIYNFKHQNDRFVGIVLFWFIQGLTSTGCTVI